MLKSGFYEQVVNKLIRRDLELLSDDNDFFIDSQRIDTAESVGVLAQYMGNVIKSALEVVQSDDALHRRLEICNLLIQLLSAETGEPFLEDYSVTSEAELLLALLDKRNTVRAVTRKSETSALRPTTSIAQSSLFTGAKREPSMINELKREILTSDRIDMLVSFIKWSGLRLMMDELREFTQTRELRIITTSYMGATDIKAIDELRALPNTHIRVSYDTNRTRLHAKAYVFHRETGFSTAYIGSSNVSNAALSTGLEWNVKVTEQDLPHTYEKVAATFEGYWNDYEFTPYEQSERPMLVRALNSERYQSGDGTHFSFDIRPYGFQREILERLEAERVVHGHYRNLVVAATGTGKTVISAFDYKRFREQNRTRPNRLLFVAHREEILKQSIDCFRTVLRDENFGDLFVGGHEPSRLDHLFISIQTFNSRNLASATSPDYFDFIVVDEFHHAAAASYQKLLDHYQPSILLGLTATPERLDGKDVTDYFDHRIAAEIRLPEAIDRELLAPFQYFGVSDNIDLSQLHWRRGGYDINELSNLYTGDRHRAELIIQSLRRYVSDLSRVIGLGFCVSVEHAEFMASFMNRNGVPSRALHAKSSADDRASAKRALTSGQLRFIFVVDLYNEGVDIPEVNTILFLRPTESLTVFLQQLGRGLRTLEGKECLTVLDFIGQSHKNYRFEDKFGALLARSRGSVQDEVKQGFQNVPRGCFIQLEKQAREYVLRNIGQGMNPKRSLIARIKTFEEDSGQALTLSNFIDHYHLSLRDLYRGNSPVSFSRLLNLAGVIPDFTSSDDHELTITKSLLRISAINSRRWIQLLLDVFEGSRNGAELAMGHNPTMHGTMHRVDPEDLSFLDHEMLLMFHYTVWQKPLNDWGFMSLSDSLRAIQKCPELCTEICDILRYNLSHIDFVDEPVDLGFDNVLDLHCSYSRDQVLAALDYYTEDKKPAMREGVKYLAEKNLDVFFITLINRRRTTLRQQCTKTTSSTMFYFIGNLRVQPPRTLRRANATSTIKETAVGWHYLFGSTREIPLAPCLTCI